MQLHRFFYLFAFCLGLGLSGLSAHAESSSHAKAFRQVIQQQMNAFQRDDATSAYSYATTSLQKRFQNPDIFIAMVKRGYAPVYRPQGVTYGRIKETDFGPVQEVYLTGPEGGNWLALYSFEQQEDGSWRISGCYLTKSQGLGA